MAPITEKLDRKREDEVSFQETHPNLEIHLSQRYKDIEGWVVAKVIQSRSRPLCLNPRPGILLQDGGLI